MQDATTQSDLHSLHSSGDLPPNTSEPTEPLANTPAAQDEPTGTLTGEPPVGGTPSPLQASGPHPKQHAFLPQRGLYYAVIAGVIAGVVTALLTMVVTLINAGTFHAASQQIAVDRLTVKTALALAAWELLTVILSLLIGFVVGYIVGRIAVRRRLGFLAGALAGAVFYLMTFLVSLISSYPGNLSGTGAMLTPGSLVISFLLLCLWCIGGGLVSLFGTWVATVRHAYYMMRYPEESPREGFRRRNA
jgi:hypothetical protein